ncbi:MAG: tRNA (N(6)-L-threonylcarbamoyladenosine(37)-C(2))-methylthiotransferase MtaB [Planctomycetaceae bacterium]|nr:MAG: tRNA (N(6)-L-threonylcarbamoyladenosine(37)-C(2))-methylthiotransferase MtaB [Planctomycetaceae bacterium]
MRSRTCRLVTLGCRVNQYETQLVKEALERHGFREATEGEPADLCIVNTCTVTNNGDSRSRQIIRQLARDNPGTRTIVMGCYATRAPDEVRQLPNVCEVITDKRELPDVLQRYGIYDLPSGISRFPSRQRAYVKVQDGCILRCSYCIIPQVRPRLSSRAPEEIVAEVERLIAAGHREIVLTGIHLGHYGVERTRGRSGLPPFRLGHLIRRLDQIPGDWRLRLSSLEAAEIDETFLQAVADCTHLCPHFHPALQSGSNRILRLMRRRYTRERFLDKLQQIQERFPGTVFSTDVLVGFPGETEEDFAETCEVCTRAGFVKIHAFPFSPRRGTPAADLPGRIPGNVVQMRMQHMQHLETQLAAAYHRQLLNRTVWVIPERECDAQPGWLEGTDEHYITVRLPGSSQEIGRLFPVRVVATEQTHVVAVREVPAERQIQEDAR